MKVVQKIELSRKFQDVIISEDSSFLSASVEFGSVYVYMQSDISANYNSSYANVGIGLFEAGEVIPDDADYFSTVIDEDFQVWLIYILFIEPLTE